ncbi:hypothetical protein GDO86_010561 [Hymenochirus boettgeri]|uniref:Uncharacterized protein n=1 Tax=Hymenochirus boettgeri TaxID=247094 RepID=A0A8T2JR04_9PIPI|nr:hypothetical protein GDO86_010561 [Hymenochirus boettgeri]
MCVCWVCGGCEWVCVVIMVVWGVCVCCGSWCVGGSVVVGGMCGWAGLGVCVWLSWWCGVGCGVLCVVVCGRLLCYCSGKVLCCCVFVWVCGVSCCVVCWELCVWCVVCVGGCVCVCRWCSWVCVVDVLFVSRCGGVCVGSGVVWLFSVCLCVYRVVFVK